MLELWDNLRIDTFQLGFGYLVVLLFAVNQLSILSNKKANDTSPEFYRLFSIKDLTTNTKYNWSMIFYVSMMWLLYTLLVFLGPDALNFLFSTDVDGRYAPLYVALIITGVIPTVVYIKDIEQWIRSRAHAFAGIPADLQTLVSRTASADVSDKMKERFYAYEHRGLFITDIAKQDGFNKSALTMWIKARALLLNLLDRDGLSDAPTINSWVHSKYLELVRDAERRLVEVESYFFLDDEDVSQWKRVKEKYDDLSSTLTLILTLVCVSVIASSDNRRSAVLNLRHFGFDVSDDERLEDTSDRAYDGLAWFSGVAASFVFLVHFVSLGGSYGQLVPGSIPHAFRVLIEVCFPMIVGTMTYLSFRRKAIEGGQWFVASDNIQVRWKRRLKATLVSMLTTVLASTFSVYFGFFLQWESSPWSFLMKARWADPVQIFVTSVFVFVIIIELSTFVEWQRVKWINREKEQISFIQAMLWGIVPAAIAYMAWMSFVFSYGTETTGDQGVGEGLSVLLNHLDEQLFSGAFAFLVVLTATTVFFWRMSRRTPESRAGSDGEHVSPTE